MTITEALAEIKTIGKRISAKREFIQTYLARQDGVKDPLEKDGGSVKMIAEAVQAISDLELRLISLRRAIQTANEDTRLTVEGVERSIAEWLIWKTEVAPLRSTFLHQLKNNLRQVREQARKSGSNIITIQQQAEKPSDVVVNMSETELAAASEKHENILGILDGQLSLKNATVMVVL